MRIRLGTPSFAGVVQQRNAAVPRLRRRCDSVHPLHFRSGRSSPAGACARPPLTCGRQRGRQAVGQPQGPPTIFEGIAQSAERMRHMHWVEGANPSALTICPRGVVQTTRLPLMQEITGLPRRSAQRVGRSKAGQGRQFSARGSRGTADPPDSESGSLGRASRLAPTSSPSKHFQRCVRSVSESARCNSE